MIKTRPLYVMASHTGTGIGRIIRAVSRFEYNHVSLTLDPSLRQWYAFARYNQDAPFYAGLVPESPERFCSDTGDVTVKIFQVALPEKKARELEQLLAQAGDPQNGLIYNHFDAVARAVGCKLLIPGCHTCLSFVTEVLDAQYLTIADLCQDLADRQIYEGSLKQLLGDSGKREEAYFAPLGLIRGSALSAIQIGKLAHRTIAQGVRIYMAYYSRRTIH